MAAWKEFFLLLCALLLRYVARGAQINRTEGYSRNVEVHCSFIDRQGVSDSFWYNISDQVYDSTGANLPPGITAGNSKVVIKDVTRDMDNWSFQCFIVDSDGVERVGEQTLLRVQYSGDPSTPDQVRLRLEPSSRGKMTFDYENIIFSAIEGISVCVNFEPNEDSACVGDFQYNLCAPPLNCLTLLTLNSTCATIPTKDLNSSFPNFVTVAANHTSGVCASTCHLQIDNPPTVEKYAAQTSEVNVPVPDLVDWRSLQMIWPTGVATTCICPPIEGIIEHCACNKGANNITISNRTLFISAMVAEQLIINFAHLSSNCNNDLCSCSRKIRRVIMINRCPEVITGTTGITTDGTGTSTTGHGGITANGTGITANMSAGDTSRSAFATDSGINSVQRDVLELDYTRLNFGAVNTSIAWRFSSLTCQPSVFTIEGYTDRGSLGDTPALVLNSTSTEISLLTSTVEHYIASGDLYIGLLAFDAFGASCAVESEVQYYKLSNAGDSIPVYVSPEGSACIPIPIDSASGRDYSSLEMVWPENSSKGSRLCYCPPFEGELNLFSNCISTVSCNTSYSIAVTDHKICFSRFSQEFQHIPVFFTLLDFCFHRRCTVRSILASFKIIIQLASPPHIPVFTLCFWNDSTTTVNSFIVNVTNASRNETAISGTYTTSQCLNISDSPLIFISLFNQGHVEHSEKGLMVPLYAILITLGFAAVIIALLLGVIAFCFCKKFRSSVPKKNRIDASRHITPPPVTAHVPVYEEIQELRESRRHDNEEENALRADYKVTECPAYAVTTAMSTVGN